MEISTCLLILVTFQSSTVTYTDANIKNSSCDDLANSFTIHEM